jgi:hypothetical protein
MATDGTRFVVSVVEAVSEVRGQPRSRPAAADSVSWFDQSRGLFAVEYGLHIVGETFVEIGHRSLGDLCGFV